MKLILTGTMLLCLLFAGCIETTSPTDNSNGETGTAEISIKIGKAGILGKTRSIEFSKLYIALSAQNEDTIYDSISLSGYNESTIIKTYTNLASLLKPWTLTAATKDIKGVIIHFGSVQFVVPARQTIPVTLNLLSKYSMLKANFFPIQDSVTRCVLKIDGNKVSDTSIMKQALIGDTVTLAFDYLHTDAAQRVKLDVFGEMWGFDTLLYTGDTLINPLPGESKSYTIVLRWVGPALPPPGNATMHVVIGSIGTTIVNGVLVQKILFKDDFNDGILDTNKWRLSCTHGPSYGGIPVSIGDSIVEQDSVLKIIQARTDWGGRIFSKTITIDTTKLLIISCRTKVHYANDYLKGSNILVKTVDPVLDTITDIISLAQHLNYRYSSTQVGFGFWDGPLLSPIWDTWFTEKLIYDPLTGVSKYVLNETDTITSVNRNPIAGKGNKIKLDLLSNGWYTGHYTWYDYVSIEQ